MTLPLHPAAPLPSQTHPRVTGICRDCLTSLPDETNLPDKNAPRGMAYSTSGTTPAHYERCPRCHSPRLLYHAELSDLHIAHIDCDAFFAAIEKRDNPELENRPVIVGGGRRGVVSTACYIARLHGVHSAMPMFKARKLCPDAVVIRPDSAKYHQVGMEIRDLMRTLTPLVQPLSIDEAFLDMSGTEKLHGMIAAASLAKLARDIYRQTGITVSIGLSHNKFLAKLASDMDKPNGFTIIGRGETKDYLARLPVSKLWGVGQATRRKLARDGITHCRQLQALDMAYLTKRYGQFGLHLGQLARGEDSRPVSVSRTAKSLSAETTFDYDITDMEVLKKELWTLCEKVAWRCKRKKIGGETIILKLKTAHFKSITRNRKLPMPSQLADTLYTIGTELLRIEFAENPHGSYRLIGIGFAGLVDEDQLDQMDLADPDKNKRIKVENVVDDLRQKFGQKIIGKGRGLF